MFSYKKQELFLKNQKKIVEHVYSNMDLAKLCVYLVVLPTIFIILVTMVVLPIVLKILTH